MENHKVRETIFIITEKECIRATGKKGKKRDLDNWLLMITMGILGSGRKIKRTAEAPISIPMGKDMKEIGAEIRNKEQDFINTKMEISMKEIGNKIEDMEKEL
eukprot:GHVR01136764.1.p3 GENE.GHVR01136764.1~~GHVR01136764.1.p3  ORF type:complete len:103 (-),score=19.16 GHVR01136764.1:1013-1321(-)